MKHYKILIYIILGVFLCATSAYSQTNAANGTYVFSKATLTIYNYHTNSEVLTREFSDTASLKGLKEMSFPAQPVFLSARIYEGVLIYCKLWNDNHNYSVEKNGRELVPMNVVVNKSGKNNDVPNPYFLYPTYKLDISGNTATFTFSQPYGSCLYNFPLEGKFVITLVKDTGMK